MEVLTEDQKKDFENRKSALLMSGMASFHHPLMVHGSYENNSENPRRATVVNYFRDGTLSNCDEPLLEGLPVVRKGEKLIGNFFPLLFDKETLE